MVTNTKNQTTAQPYDRNLVVYLDDLATVFECKYAPTEPQLRSGTSIIDPEVRQAFAYANTPGELLITLDNLHRDGVSIDTLSRGVLGVLAVATTAYQANFAGNSLTKRGVINLDTITFLYLPGHTKPILMTFGNPIAPAGSQGFVNYKMFENDNHVLDAKYASLFGFDHEVTALEAYPKTFGRVFAFVYESRFLGRRREDWVAPTKWMCDVAMGFLTVCCEDDDACKEAKANIQALLDNPRALLPALGLEGQTIQTSAPVARSAPAPVQTATIATAMMKTRRP